MTQTVTVPPRPGHPWADAAADPSLASWPVVGLLALYPLWWALGLGVLIFPLAAIPMAVALLRRQAASFRGRRPPVRLPPGFGLWLLFLAAVVVSAVALGADPAGTVPGTAMSRLPAVVFRVGEYASLTILLVYVGNVDRTRLPQRTLVRLLAWLFVVTVLGGLLGMVAGNFEFSSPVELTLPQYIRQMSFVQSLVHPSAAQIMDLVGGERPRPAAPWGYTNTWGNNFCLLVVWFVVAGWSAARTRTMLCLAVAIVPVVYSLNRGLWIGLGLVACYVAVHLARRGRMGALAGIGAAATLLALALALTPLGGVVGQRLDNGKSNGVRLYLTDRALAGIAESPLVGFGSTRTTQGGRNSITVGESAGCERCGNFTIGGNGQLWQLLFAHGLLGTAAYLGFFAYALWRFRGDRTPTGLAGRAALVSTFAAMFWYNALVTPLAFTFCAHALLWRNEGEPAR
jgi:hypothetical protein